ncbi:cytochrome P450 [Streptomyces armeniacus]|uniref:Cytochrome P450 n=1 Tax=Streptomyces armeniacus TaxID=83291 RepID=A0A345XWX2_9ACTN|nr:cytochrome P450 [Streptomyces armeniacus]AXK36138.1 cytochrome P450 [Streptomyces armeniacus]QIQ28629.1 Nbc33 [Streptomyces sp.]
MVEAPVVPSKRTCPFDPAEEYGRLREEEPISPIRFKIAPQDPNGWLVTRHDYVRQILADNRFSHRNELCAHLIEPPFPIEKYEPEPSAPGSFVRMDKPEHTKYRTLLAGHFTVRKIREYEPTLAKLIDEVLDELETKDRPLDLISEFAEVIPARSVCSMMGVPPDMVANMSTHFAAIFALQYTMEEFVYHMEEVQKLLVQLVEQRIEQPSDDIFSHLVATGELTVDEIANMAWIIIGGALDTTPNMMGLSTFALLEHPEQLEKFRANPEIVEGSVEELLRYLTVSQFGASRAALEDVEIGGITIKKGQTVVLSLPAANRDPDFFTDADELDVTRSARKHVAFGFGIHQCLGQHLARATLRIGLSKLFDRFPTLRLAVDPSEVPLRERAMHYGADKLLVTWDD